MLRRLILPPSQPSKVNPFSLNDEEILPYIIASHDPKSKIHDVDHVYNKASNIVKEANSNHIINKHFELKYGESKISGESNFLPTFRMLKDISSQMTCKYFNAYIAHETIIWIFKKLPAYNWATKGVIVLAAFSLDYGEPWHVSKMAPTEANSLEIHISGGEGLKRPIEGDIDYNTLIDPALQLIKVVIDIEKLIVKNDKLQGTIKDVLDKVPRHIYTYWAMFALLACAAGMALDLKSELRQRIGRSLSGFASQWKPQIAEIEDYFWRLNVFRSPSGIVQLLTALIYPRDIPYPEVYDNTNGSLVKPGDLETMYLLLFISGVQSFKRHIKGCIKDLHPIHQSFKEDPKKSNYQILWVPVEDKWNQTKKKQFKKLKSMIPWYIVEYLEPIKGYKLLKELWKYPVNDSIVVVVDPQGNILHPDALPMIVRWGDVTAFPFTLERQEQLSKQHGWLWGLLVDAAPSISNWFRRRRYIFVYGGTNKAQVEKFGDLVKRVKEDKILQSQEVVNIEHCNLGEELEIFEKFWDEVKDRFREQILNRKDEDNELLFLMEMLLAMKNEKAWALFSKGRNVLVVDYDSLIYDTLSEFEKWKTNILKQGFHKAFIEYYHNKCAQEPERHCYYIQLENLPFAPQNVICPEPNCRLEMKVKSIEYMCCHEELNQRLKGTAKKKDDEATVESLNSGENTT